MSDDDTRQHESGQLGPEDRQRVRRDFGRIDALWSKFGGQEGEQIRQVGRIFGPLAAIIGHWQYILAVIAVVTMINSPRILAALEALGGQ